MAWNTDKLKDLAMEMSEHNEKYNYPVTKKKKKPKKSQKNR